jgi:hypothetical protein
MELFIKSPDHLILTASCFDGGQNTMTRIKKIFTDVLFYSALLASAFIEHRNDERLK